MIILGLNVYHADASAAIVVDGKLIAAAEEERFNRIKHCAGLPAEAVKYCLKEAGASIKDVDYIAIPRSAKARFFKKLYYGVKIPRLALRRLHALGKTRNIKTTIAGIFNLDDKEIKANLVNIEHHKAHIASSFFVSPFERASLFSADGLGDFASTMWGGGEGNKMKIAGDISFPHSLGLYYTAITQYLGFCSFGDEYKVMGLAAYGTPEYKDEFEKILKYSGGMKFELGLRYFLHHKKLVDMNFEAGYPALDILFSEYLEKRLGPARKKDEPVEERHKNIAASLQSRIEEIIFSLLNELYRQNNLDTLCLSGGVAFNCVANGKIYTRAPFKNIYIPPAPGDAGLAIGAAYYLWHEILGKPRNFVMDHAFWGPAYDSDMVSAELQSRRDELNQQGCKVTQMRNDQELYKITAQAIADGKIVGWFQGRTEWGPRALGNRSIVVDPRRAEMKDILNSRIKRREPFRPFAPSILEEKTGDYFEQTHPSPFMLFTYKVKPDKEKLIPAPTHIDGTGRLQTVSKRANLRYWNLIKEFENITGVPVVLNTSFNENEPIVNTPKEALDCFLRTRMDVLALGAYVIERQNKIKSSFPSL